MTYLGIAFLISVGLLLYFALTGERTEPVPDAHEEPMGEASSYRRERK